MKIGILALQGDFFRHYEAVKQLGHEALFVKDAAALQQCDKLIIPGGESTTFLHLIEKLRLRQALTDFGKNKAIMGTCAGLILLGKTREKLPFDPLGLIDINVRRNAYGRQVDSFIDQISLNMNGHPIEFEGVFIRAPKIETCGERIKVLGEHRQDVVMAAQDNILVMTFHPELTGDLRVHDFFINKIG